jgi:UPF0716 protein FxsA
MKWLLFLYPWLELWSLIELGTQTSATTAMLWVLGAGVLGIGLFRLAGRQTLEHLQRAQREGVLSQQLLMGNVSRFVAGVLLIIPGLISDALAVFVLIAPLRMLLAKLLFGGSISAQCNPYQGQGRRESSGFHTGPGQRRFEDDGVTLEGEFESVSPEQEGEDREAPAPLKHQPTERD